MCSLMASEPPLLPDSSVRLNKYISESGICSRREADRYIEQGNVFLNGKRATIGDQEFAHAAKRIAISSKAMCSLMASEPPLAIR